MKPVRVLVVCLGNICRSPMAGGLLRDLFRESKLEAEVRTAGLNPYSAGASATRDAIEVMGELGLDISEDSSKPVTQTLMDWADHVIPVEAQHAGELARRFPGPAAKIRRLREDVPDPYGEDLAVYRRVRDQLRSLLREVVSALDAQPGEGRPDPGAPSGH